jgi:hypothetical protein
MIPIGKAPIGIVLFTKILGGAVAVVTAGMLLAPNVAHARENYYVAIPEFGTPIAGTHYGNVTFWSRKDTFVADMTVTDDDNDSSGQNAYFYVTNVSNGTGYTRKLYWGGGVNTQHTFSNEKFQRPANIKNVRALICLTDDGDEWGCNIQAGNLDNPYT